MEQMSCAGDDSPKQQRDPGEKSHQQNWPVVPEGLDVLEFGGEVALEIMFDDEDAEEIGVTAGAEGVTGGGGEAEKTQSGGREKGGRGGAARVCGRARK